MGDLSTLEPHPTLTLQSLYHSVWQEHRAVLIEKTQGLHKVRIFLLWEVTTRLSRKQKTRAAHRRRYRLYTGITEGICTGYIWKCVYAFIFTGGKKRKRGPIHVVIWYDVI